MPHAKTRWQTRSLHRDSRVRITLCCVGSGDRNIILSLFCLYVWLIQRLSMSCAALNLTKTTTQAPYTVVLSLSWFKPAIHEHPLYPYSQYTVCLTLYHKHKYFRLNGSYPFTVRFRVCGWLKAPPPPPLILARTSSKKIPYGANITWYDRNCVSSSRFGQIRLSLFMY